MNKVFNNFCILTGAIGGVFTKILGDVDKLLSALIILMLFDYITGLLKGYYQKNLDSQLGFWGIIKKVIILIIVSTSYILGNLLEPSMPLREIVITFFVANESLSILENAAVFVPIPESIRNAINQIRETNKDI